MTVTSNNAISRELLGKIVDEVFDGAIEDAGVIEEIYAVITRDMNVTLSSRSAEAGKPAEVQLHAIVDAWEALPGGRQVRNSDVEEWLAGDMAPAINAIRGFLRRPKPDGTVPPAPHADDIAVDQFAAAMKAKLAKKRAEGRGGWENKDECTAEFLSSLLRDHVGKGDPLDVGNLAMMLHQRGECISALSTPADSEPVAWRWQFEDGGPWYFDSDNPKAKKFLGGPPSTIEPLYAAPVADGEPGSVPDDVVNLVVAAREFWDANNDLSDESRALDKALEPFSSLVPFENEPDDVSGPRDMIIVGDTAYPVKSEVCRAFNALLADTGRMWPDFIAPPQYENPSKGWTDPSLPDFRLIWQVASSVGYSVGLHGSMKRDCDLIAAPWTEEAESAEVLVSALCAALNARQVSDFKAKPLGRLAVTLDINGWFKSIDLSIAPRQAAAAAPQPNPSAVDAVGWQEAARIGDTVLAWMVKYDLLDAGNEYRAEDVVAVLNDFTPSDATAELKQLRDENAKFRKALTKIAERADDNLPMYTPGAMVHTADAALAAQGEKP